MRSPFWLWSSAIETAGRLERRLVLDGLGQGGERVVRLAELEESSTESLANAAILGVELEPGVQPLLGRLPIPAGLRHRGQAREGLAAQELCFLGIAPAGTEQ